MNMKDHILAALHEQLMRWEELLAGLHEEELTSPQFDLDWSIKDVIAHLWAWQQISIARMEAGVKDQEPKYPQWIVSSIENWEENADHVNALTFKTQYNQPWSEIHLKWKNGFQQFLALGKALPERDLLDGDRYLWLRGYSLAFILIASYDHHQEHYEKLLAWLEK